MTPYRCYFLNFKDKIQKTAEFEAPDDTAALAQGERLRGEHFAVEVWESTRLVGRTGGELDLSTAARG